MRIQSCTRSARECPGARRTRGVRQSLWCNVECAELQYNTDYAECHGQRVSPCSMWIPVEEADSTGALRGSRNVTQRAEHAERAEHVEQFQFIAIAAQLRKRGPCGSTRSTLSTGTTRSSSNNSNTTQSKHNLETGEHPEHTELVEHAEHVE